MYIIYPRPGFSPFIVYEMSSKDGDESAGEEDEPAEKDDILVAVVRQPLA
jgi:hypothetical protein